MNKRQLNKKLIILTGGLTLVVLAVSVIWSKLIDVPTKCELVGGKTSLCGHKSMTVVDETFPGYGFSENVPYLDGGIPNCANVSAHVCLLIGGDMSNEIGQGTVCAIPCP